MMVISTAHVASLVTLSVVNLLLSATKQSSACSQLYVKLGDSSAVDTASCGTPSLPCSTIHRAISNQRQRFPTDNCTAVHLQPSKYNSPISCEVLQSLNSIIIDGASAGEIPLKLVNCSEPNTNITSSWMVLTGVTNLKLQNLYVDLENFTGCSAVGVQYSDNVTFVNSEFSNPMINTSAIFSSNNFDVVVSGCRFKGYHRKDPYYREDPYEVPQYRLAILIVKITCVLGSECNKSSQDQDLAQCCPTTFLPATAGDSIGVTVEYCTFKSLGILPNLYAEVTPTHYADASAIHFSIDAAVDFNGIVRNCTFHENYSPYDTVLKLYAGPGTTNTKFRVEDSSFSNGRAYVGGAAFLRIMRTSVNTTLHVVRSVFVNNTAASQGGALAFALGRTQIEVLTAFETLAAVFIDGSTFQSNSVGRVSRISAGGAISMISPFFYAAVFRAKQQLPTVAISNTIITGNTAYYNAAVYASGANLTMENTLVSYHSEDTAIGIPGSGLILGENVTFLGNSSPAKGGVIGIYQDGFLDFRDNASVYFINNSALLEGGAIYADTPTSTVRIGDLLQFSSNVGLSKPCFIHSGPDAVFAFNLSMNYNASIVFEGNRAFLGNSIYANSFTPCLREKNPILPNLDQETDAIEYKSSPTASGAVWISFLSAGCTCLKINPFNRTVHWMYHKSCDRETIFKDVQNNSLFTESGYTSLLQAYASDLRLVFKNSPDTNGYGAFASPQVMAVPWSVTTFEWYYPRGSRQQYTESQLTGSLLTATYTSSLTLYPAPGQMFPLQIQTADVYFRLVYTLLQLQVKDGSALLLYNGDLHARLDTILFVQSSPITIGLVGKPGAEGTLRIRTNGQISTAVLELVIPFRLSPCHTGFYETSFMSTATEEEIDRYVNTTVKTRLDGNSSSNVNKLICQCPTGVPGVQYCANGSDIIMNWAFWAGEDRSSSTNGLYESEPLQAISNLQDYEASWRERKFLTSVCYRGYCQNHGQVDWNVHQDPPCIASRHGAICGQCQEEFSQALAWNPACIRCTEDLVLFGQLSFLLLFVYCGLDLFFFSYFELGKSAIFDAWVTFEQFCLFTTRREVVFQTLLTFSTFSCASLKTNILQATSVQYTVSAFLFLWLVLVFQLSRFVVVRRFVLNHSLVVGLWAVVTFSYGYVVFPSFNLLACHKFNGKFVLFADASIECFGSEHWPYALLALCALLLVAIPLPILLFVMRSSPRIKPLIDVYLSFVRDDRCWFIAYGMARRILVCIISVYVVDSTQRQLSLALVFQVFLFLHFVIQPYREKVDNIWEATFLSFSCLFAIINILKLNTNPTLLVLLRVAYAVPVCAAVLYGIVVQWKKVLALVEYFLTCFLAPILIVYYRRQNKPVRRFRFVHQPEMTDANTPLLVNSTPEEAMERAKAVYQLRDDLLVDFFQDDAVST